MINKTRRWVVVANRAGAKLYEHHGRTAHPLSLIKEWENPKARLRDRDINSDRPGRSGESGAHARHGMESEHSAHEKAAEDFARELTVYLDQTRMDHGYDQLVLVAEPQFLGMVRNHLTPQTKTLVTAELSKDLVHHAVNDLPKHLESIIAV